MGGDVAQLVFCVLRDCRTASLLYIGCERERLRHKAQICVCGNFVQIQVGLSTLLKSQIWSSFSVMPADTHFGLYRTAQKLNPIQQFNIRTF